MKQLKLTLTFPSGGLLIGGVSAAPAGVHIMHAAQDGRAFIPATAIRGALRQSLEALLRGMASPDQPAPVCAGGTGVPYGSLQAAQPCTLENGRPCVPCRLFGGQREDLPAQSLRFSALDLHDAHCQTEPGWMTRPGLGRSRASRSAEEQRLFMQRVPSRRQLRFEATGCLKDEQLLFHLKAAVRATTHIGSGRSRGMARAELQLELCSPPSEPHLTLPSPDAVSVRVTLRSPTALAAPVSERNLLECRLDVPGSTLRGAVGFTLAEILNAQALDPNADAAFQALVANSGAHFGFLHPTEPCVFPHSVPGPLPITAMLCKQAGRTHKLRDSLLELMAATLIEQPEQMNRLSRIRSLTCTCGAPLRNAHGWRTHRSAPSTQTRTRVSLDRGRDAAAHEQLFCQEQLQPGAVFEGSIRQIPAESRVRLAQGLNSLRALGRGSAHGWGQVQVEVLEPPRWKPLVERRQQFQQKLRELLKKLKLDEKQSSRLVPITLLSPLIPLDGGDGAQSIAQDLGAELFLSQRRFSREGSWDQRSGQMTCVQAVAAGAVFVVRFPAQLDEKNMLERLAHLEASGSGDRRHQGFGQLLIYDPFFTQGDDMDSRHLSSDKQESSPLEGSDLDSRIRPYRKHLVVEAERVMEEAFNSERKGTPNKSQFNHLIGICSQAEVEAEIKNYLRYQAGRGERTTGWNLKLVQSVIGGAEAAMNSIAEDDDPLRVYGWRLYTTFLTRAFTYHQAVEKDRHSGDRRSDHPATRRADATPAPRSQGGSRS
ncbi:MAG: RAMP superfamily CRISPR-associated protein [Myxococcota bacterium]